MQKRIIVNYGEAQEAILVGDNVDEAIKGYQIVWDERVDGPIPEALDPATASREKNKLKHDDGKHAAREARRDQMEEMQRAKPKNREPKADNGMAKFLVNSPNGHQEYVYAPAGAKYHDPSRIVWSWDDDGEPPVFIVLGAMERIERIEHAQDENGKKQYEKVVMGEKKSQTKKVAIRERVVYLSNKRIGKKAKSKRAPTRLPPEE